MNEQGRRVKRFKSRPGYKIRVRNSSESLVLISDFFCAYFRFDLFLFLILALALALALFLALALYPRSDYRLLMQFYSKSMSKSHKLFVQDY